MIFLGSRGRPASLQRVFDSNPTHPGIVMLDEDDAHNYAKVRIPPNWTIEVEQRTPLVPRINKVVARFPDLEWYGFGCDDIICSPGWDVELAKEAGRYNVAWGDDLINGVKLSAVPFVGGDLVRAAGWFYPPVFKHLYGDYVWYLVSQALGNGVYRPDVITEHLHWSTGKQPYDQTARERPVAHDHAVWPKFEKNELPVIIDRLKRLRPC